MRIVVLVPGIMGSRLALAGNEVWPPTPFEFATGYGRIADLMSDALVATDVIRQVACFGVYGSLIDALTAWGFAEKASGGKAGRLVCWPYDWRRDNRDSAAALSAALGQLLQQGGAGTRLTLLAHSMGGLVARYALETASASLGDTTWRGAVDLFVTFGTPHRGAPLALVRALGLEGTTGISAADTRTVLGDPRYPAGYQLLPPADAQAFWAKYTGSLPAVDVFDPAVAGALGLNTDNITAARDFYAELDAGQRAACRYFNFIGRTLDTVVRCDFQSASKIAPASVGSGGDGTVPSWSGTLPDVQFQLDGEEHSHTFRAPAVLSTLGALLGVPPALLATTAAAAVVPLEVRVPGQVFAASSAVRVTVLARIDAPGALQLDIHELDAAGVLQQPAVASTPVAPSATSSQSWIVPITLPAKPGLYAAVVRSSAPTATIESRPEPFAVQRER